MTEFDQVTDLIMAARHVRRVRQEGDIAGLAEAEKAIAKAAHDKVDELIRNGTADENG